MTIKDIAKLAGVSVSTVSKIVNGKDENIGAATRARVLEIVKSYRYTPYSSVLNGAKGRKKSFLLGVLFDGARSYEELLRGIMEGARRRGYSAVVCTRGDAAEEEREIARLAAHALDGVIWERSAEEQSGVGIDVPTVVLRRDGKAAGDFSLDYGRIAYEAAASLIACGHQRIGCIAREENREFSLFAAGVAQCLHEHRVPFEVKLCAAADENFLSRGFFLRSVTGVVCCDLESAARVYREAAQQNLRIPQDLSVAALLERDAPAHMMPPLSGRRIPLREMGEQAAARVIAAIEKEKASAPRLRSIEIRGGSLDRPARPDAAKIVVAGSINVDTFVNVGCFPRLGETVVADSRATIPGGKALNQAVGAAKLGAPVALLGRIGRDYEGGLVMDLLREHRIDTQGVAADENLATGHAYIYVQRDGESGIVVYEGANRNFGPEAIAEHEALFEGAGFCLVQTEVAARAAEAAARAAKKYGAQVIVKPAAVTAVSDALLQHTDIFLPNRNELAALCPQESTVEARANYFLGKGVVTVIVTLGREGCYLAQRRGCRYFPAAAFKAVDTTGAADAFAAALAVYLSRGYAMAAAIQYAVYAAGFSTTRQGVPPALADRSVMELYQVRPEKRV